MPDGDDLRQIFAQANQQSAEFMRQAREQARQQLEVQRYHISQSFGQAGMGQDFPPSGTPAGRLLDTINTLVRQGAVAGGGAVAGIAGGAWGAGMGQMGALGGMMGQAAVAPLDLGGRMFTDTQRRMSFFQTAATALGVGFARQRLDMTSTQAAQMANEELGARGRAGFARGTFGVANVATFGVGGYLSRLWGVEQEWQGREALVAGLQEQMRYVRRGALEAAGIGGAAGAFPTGVTREQARTWAGNLGTDVYSPMQQQYGITGREISVIQARAMGTMGRQGIENLFKSGTLNTGEVGRQMRGVVETQQILNMTDEEATQFWNMVGQMHGTADRISRLARQAKGMGAGLGLQTRETMQTMLEFERVGVQTGMGADRARSMAENYTQTLYENYRRGGISAEQMMMYGGDTPEAGLRFQTQARYQQNMQMWAGGAGMMGMGVLARNRGAWGRLVSGRMGFMETMGAVGAEYARDPFAGLSARFDPAVHQTIGSSADRAIWQTVQQLPVIGTNKEAVRLQRLARFQKETGYTDLQARTHDIQFAGELEIAKTMVGGDEAAARDLSSVYSALTGTGAAGLAASRLGEGSVWTAAKRLYDVNIAAGKGKFDPSKSIADLVSSVSETLPEAAAGDVAARVKNLGRRGGGDPIAALEEAARVTVAEAQRRGRTVGSEMLNRMFLFGQSSGLAAATERFGSELLSFDEKGNLVVARSGAAERVGERARISDLGNAPDEVEVRQRIATAASAWWDASRYQGSTVKQKWAERFMKELQSAPSDINAFAQRLVFEQGAGLASTLFKGFKAGERPMEQLMGRVAQMDLDAQAMGKVSQYGLSESMGLFSQIYAMKDNRIALQEGGVVTQALAKSLGPERLASALNIAVGEAQSLLETPDKADALYKMLGNKDTAARLFNSLWDSVDKAKFNQLGATIGNALFVNVVNVEELGGKVKPVDGANEKD
jgi:hypothetical protein